MRELKPWEERFVKEYRELAEKRKRLGDMLEKWNLGTLEFAPKCPYDLLWKQYLSMGEYENVLLERADIKGVPLFEKEEEPHFCYECVHSITTVHDCGTADRGYQLCAKGCHKLDPAYCGHFIAGELR